MSLFTCPICAAPLAREGNTYRCPNRHSYDVAREGYVHLLPANKKHSANPGDDRDMAAARTRFLDGGWYAPLRDTLCRLAEEYTGPAPAVLDAGCGEGYYTAGIFERLKNKKDSVSLAGVDLSKSALKKAARRTPEGEFAVASVYHLPAADGAADLLVDCFAPLALEEYRRVLKPGGVFLYVVPAPRHLLELKAVLYDTPYENPEESPEYDGFTRLGITKVESQMDLPAPALMDLFRMTPYVWKTPREGIARLEALSSLTVTAAFHIHAYRRTDA
jgi:23S rRNA (guanine745-N1)-methyltransferase